MTPFVSKCPYVKEPVRRSFTLVLFMLAALTLLHMPAAGQFFVDRLRIKTAVTISVGDVALYTPFQSRQIINPAFGRDNPLPNDIYQLRLNSRDGTVSVSDLFLSSAADGIPDGT